MRIEELAKYFDHTLLKADATRAEVEKTCDEAMELGVKTVCLNSQWMKVASARLSSSSVRPISVIGFPLGAMSTASKVFETRRAIEDGASEIDMVFSIGAFKSLGTDRVAAINDVAEVLKACGDGVKLKVILETALLNEKELFEASFECAKLGVHFIKTSTGFSTRGASLKDIEIMKSAIHDANASTVTAIKASGGIRTLGDATAMISAGATRLGASATRAILNEFRTGKTSTSDGGQGRY